MMLMFTIKRRGRRTTTRKKGENSNVNTNKNKKKNIKNISIRHLEEEEKKR